MQKKKCIICFEFSSDFVKIKDETKSFYYELSSMTVSLKISAELTKVRFLISLFFNNSSRSPTVKKLKFVVSATKVYKNAANSSNLLSTIDQNWQNILKRGNRSSFKKFKSKSKKSAPKITKLQSIVKRQRKTTVTNVSFAKEAMLWELTQRKCQSSELMNCKIILTHLKLLFS